MGLSKLYMATSATSKNLTKTGVDKITNYKKICKKYSKKKKYAK